MSPNPDRDPLHEELAELRQLTESQARQIKQLKALIRPEDRQQCLGRRSEDAERCQRPAELGQAYCRQHLAGQRRGQAQLAKTRAKREQRGVW